MFEFTIQLKNLVPRSADVELRLSFLALPLVRFDALLNLSVVGATGHVLHRILVAQREHAVLVWADEL